MEKLLIDERHVLDYVEDNIIRCLSERVEVYDDKFHHNTKYKDAISIIKNGILSPQLQITTPMQSHSQKMSM